MRFLLNIFIVVLVVNTAFSQEIRSVLSQDDIVKMIKENHPVAKRAELMLAKGKQYERKARGNFDPKLEASLNEKGYKGTEYYSLFSGGLKVPTWYGVELKAGFEENAGYNLNPQNNLPDNGIAFAGMSIPIGRDLIIDKRRATLRQAQIYREASLFEQENMMNNLLFDGIKSYWKWVQAWNEYQVYKRSVQLVEERFAGVRQSFEFGDKPAIDTLEAFIQVQNRQMSRNQALIKYRNASLDLSNYLWIDGEIPLEITDSLHPAKLDNVDENHDKIEKVNFDSIVINLASEHPTLILYQYKVDQYKVEKRLKQNNLLPKLNVNYNVLNEPINNDPFNDINTQNYKWGFDLSIPLFMRKEIGDYQLAKIKLNDAQLSQDQKILSVQNKVRQYMNEATNLQEQVVISIANVKNYEQLLEGEKLKFDSGESSLFLINSREKNLIKAQLKQLELISKYNISSVGVLWAKGRLFD